jgi:hypothetical protein
MSGAFWAGWMLRVTRGTKAGAAQIRSQAARSKGFWHFMSKMLHHRASPIQMAAQTPSEPTGVYPNQKENWYLCSICHRVSGTTWATGLVLKTRLFYKKCGLMACIS